MPEEGEKFAQARHKQAVLLAALISYMLPQRVECCKKLWHCVCLCVQVDTTWRDLMEAAHANASVLVLARDPEHLARLEEANKLLEEIQKVCTARLLRRISLRATLAA